MASNKYKQQDDGDSSGNEEEPVGQSPTGNPKFVINKTPNFSGSVISTLCVSDDLLVAAARTRYKPTQNTSQSIHCWCFATHGLQKYVAKEVCLLLECLPDEDTVPKLVLRYLTLLHDNTKRGTKLSEGSFTPLPGDSDVAGFVHMRRRPSQDVGNLVIPTVPHLFSILIKKEELFWIEKKLTDRLMLKLGRLHSCYPFPLWCPCDRRPVCDGFHDSVLASQRVNRLPDVVTHADNNAKIVTMYLPDACHPQMLEILEDKHRTGKDTENLIFVTDISDLADGHMVYCPDKEFYCISNHNQEPIILGLTFVNITVLPSNDSTTPSGAIPTEDGVVVAVTSDEFCDLSKALREKKEFRLESDFGLYIKWISSPINKTVTPHWISPIDGKSMSDLRAQRRDDVRVVSDEDGVCLLAIIQISNNQDIRVAGINKIQVAKLVETVSQAVVCLLKPFWESSDLNGIEKIGLRVFARPGISHGIYSCGSQPLKLPTKCCQALRQHLFSVEFPKVQNSITFELTFQVKEKLRSTSDL